MSWAFVVAFACVGCGGGGGGGGPTNDPPVGGAGPSSDSGPNCSPCTITNIDAFNGLFPTIFAGTATTTNGVGIPTVLETETTNAVLPNGVNYGPGGGDEIKSIVSYLPKSPYPPAKGTELMFTSFVISPNRVTFQDPTDPNAKFLIYAQYQVQAGPDFFGLKVGDTVYCSFYVGSTFIGVGSNVVTNRNAFDGSSEFTAFSCDASQNGTSNNSTPFSVPVLDPTTTYTLVFSK